MGLYFFNSSLSGVFFLDNPGDATLKADSGKIASVKYRGYLMTDNSRVFDTNLDSSKGHTDPYDVAVGRRVVIPGWDEGLPYFGKGGSGKIIVPAFLAYGPQGAPPDIPGNANLVFDMQVLDVKDAPPAQEADKNPVMPHGH